MNTLSIRLFGHFAVLDETGRAITLTGTKQKALLAYLALNLGRPSSRDRLAGLLWGDRFDEQARQSLRQSLMKLRRLGGTGGALFRADGDTIELDPDAVSIDAIDFEKAAGNPAPETLVQATKLCGGQLLESLFLNAPAFDEWLATERARFNMLACTVFERAAMHLHQERDASAAIELAQRLVAIDPLREPSHRLLMSILAESGQRAAALKQYATCESVLCGELGVQPDDETRALMEEIRRTGGGSAATAPSAAGGSMPSARLAIAVLPFADLSDDGAGNSVARSMTEDIITALARSRWLSVVGRFSAGAEPRQLLDVARAQGAAYAIEGSVRRVEGRLRVNVNLLDLQSGRYVWVQRYDRAVEDLLQAQDEITEQIAGSLEPEIAVVEAQRARTKPEGGLTARDHYLLGLEAQYQFSREGNLEAQRLFRKALELDPEFAIAYARLAYAMVIGAIYFEAKPVEAILDEALDLARRATRLDDQDAVARFALGRTLLAKGSYDISVRELQTAIDLNPTLAQAHCALGDSLAYSGRLDESIPRFEEAVRISPHDPYRWAFLTYGAMAYLFRHDYEEAANWAYEATRVPNAHYSANATLVATLGHLDRPEETGAALADLIRIRPGFTCRLGRERLFYLKDEGQLEIYLSGLRRAGVPE